MRAAVLLLAAAASGAATPAAPAPAQPTWTLAAAVEQALAASPEAHIAEARTRAAEAAVAEADAQARPRLDLRVAYLQTTQPMHSFGAILNQGTFSDQIDFNDPGQIDAFTAGLHARYPVYSGGRVSALRGAARAGREAATQEAEAARRRLTFNVVQTYFAIREAGEAVVALEQAVASLAEAARVAGLREESGQLLHSERLNLEVEHAQQLQQLLAARHAVLLAQRRLALLLGLPANTEIALRPDDPTPAQLQRPDDEKIETRPELLALQQQLEAVERRARAARAARGPTVGAFASAQVDHGWRRSGSGESWTAGLAAEVPVFDGAEARARVSAADAQLELVRAQLRQTELQLAYELTQARLAHQLARDQLAVTTRSVEQADASARLSRDRFAAGALLSAELIGVEARLAEARVRRAAALGQERTSLAALRLAAGYPPFE